MEDKKQERINPRTLPGFVELMPEYQIEFNKIYDKIRKSYEKFGFVPLDTPVLEYSDVLLAKAGGETEKQIYRFTKGDTDISMRFDLTVPLAKYVAMHSGELTFPFRRYQIGKVYRGERNQKGRFREFYQADIDIIGEDALSLVADSELVAVIYSTFKELGFTNFTVRINNRKILNGLFEGLGLKEKAVEVLRIIDKIDKIGIDAMCEMLKEIEVTDENINKIVEFLQIKGSNDEKLEKLSNLGLESDEFKEGIAELKEVLQNVKAFGVPDNNYMVDLTIARGLDYYTGTVYETILNDYKDIGSVCSGGRYDNLTGFYSNKKLPGVGISIGLSRLFYKFCELGIVKAESKTQAKVMIIPMLDSVECMQKVLSLATILRENNINTEVNYSKKSIKSMLNYANKLGVNYVVIIGEEELNSDIYTLKNMQTGEQEKLGILEIVGKLSK